MGSGLNITFPGVKIFTDWMLIVFFSYFILSYSGFTKKQLIALTLDGEEEGAEAGMVSLRITNIFAESLEVL